MEYFLFFLFSFGLLSSCFFVAFLTNPINAVFFLVLAFCNATGLLLLLEAEFLALLFLVVYVGAIAVLFLFVIIILNLKETFNNNNVFIISFKNFFFFIFLFFIFSYQLFFILNIDFTIYKQNVFFTLFSYIEWMFFLDFFHNIFLFGQIIYTFYFYYFLVAGFVLLVSIVGAVSLTAQKHNLKCKNKSRRQFVFNQLARTKQNAVFVIKRLDN
jgi:NADH-quinone oxidoreductase subunit J